MVEEFLRGTQWAGWAPHITTALRIVIIVALAYVFQGLSRRAIRAVREYMTRQQGSTEDVKRIDTISRVIRYIVSVLIVAVAGMAVLGELGVAIGPILGAAGVVGLAVGFGAQSLVKDYFTGFFLLLENQVRVGDVVEVGGKGGLVEEMTLRFIRLRDFEGNVHYIPNGTITVVTNRSRGFAQALIEVGVAYREDIDECLEVMRRVGMELRADEKYGPKILDDVEIVGVENWADSAVVLRCRLKVLPLEQWNVRREFLRRLKYAYDAAGIEIPYPHLTIYAGQDKRGEAPPLRIINGGSAAAPENAK